MNFPGNFQPGFWSDGEAGSSPLNGVNEPTFGVAKEEHQSSQGMTDDKQPGFTLNFAFRRPSTWKKDFCADRAAESTTFCGRRNDQTGILKREYIDYTLVGCGDGHMSSRAAFSCCKALRNATPGPSRHPPHVE